MSNNDKGSVVAVADAISTESSVPNEFVGPTGKRVCFLASPTLKAT